MVDHPWHCGPGWLPRWIKKRLGYRFNEACYIHDVDYREQTKTKKDADYDFLDNMLDLAQHPGEILLAVLYFYVVYYFGGKSWNEQLRDKED